MSRTVSARIPKEMHENLREKCNDLGCSINDYIGACIELMITGSSEFDFGDEEDSNMQKTAKDIQSDEEKFKPHYDCHGNYYTYDKDRKMWTCHLKV